MLAGAARQHCKSIYNGSSGFGITQSALMLAASWRFRLRQHKKYCHFLAGAGQKTASWNVIYIVNKLISVWSTGSAPDHLDLR
jgi:hypothetical protein